MGRIVPAAVLVALLAACSHRAPSSAPAAVAATPPKAAFEAYPAAEVAGVKDPHDYRGKALCQRCHLPDLKLKSAPNALCKECHNVAHGDHPVDVVQKAAVKDLPLGAGGTVVCHTCHDPHQKKKVLRMKFNELCRSCHSGH